MQPSTRKDLVILAAPWRSHSEGFRAGVAEDAGEIRTYDGGLLMLEGGRWTIVRHGDMNDATMVLDDIRGVKW